MLGLRIFLDKLILLFRTIKIKWDILRKYNIEIKGLENKNWDFARHTF